MRRKHPGGGMHHRCTLAGLPASMAFRWRKSPCRPSLSQKNTASRGRVAQICGKSNKSEQAGGRGASRRARRRSHAPGEREGTGRPVGASRRARGRGQAPSKAPGEPTSAGFTRRSRPTPSWSASVLLIGTGATARQRLRGTGTRLFSRRCTGKVSRRARETGRFRTAAGGHNPNSREKGQKYAQ